LNPSDEYEIAVLSTYLIIRHCPQTPPIFFNQLMNVESIDENGQNKNEQLNKKEPHKKMWWADINLWEVIFEGKKVI